MVASPSCQSTNITGRTSTAAVGTRGSNGAVWPRSDFNTCLCERMEHSQPCCHLLSSLCYPCLPELRSRTPSQREVQTETEVPGSNRNDSIPLSSKMTGKRCILSHVLHSTAARWRIKLLRFGVAPPTRAASPLTHEPGCCQAGVHQQPHLLRKRHQFDHDASFLSIAHRDSACRPHFHSECESHGGEACAVAPCGVSTIFTRRSRAFLFTWRPLITKIGDVSGHCSCRVSAVEINSASTTRAGDATSLAAIPRRQLWVVCRSPTLQHCTSTSNTMSSSNTGAVSDLRTQLRS